MRTGREVSVLIHRAGHVLLMRRARDGIWHIPAGGVEEGEASEEAARRELREESGFRATRLEDLGHTCRYPIMADDHRAYPDGVSEITHETFAVEAPAGWEPRLDAEHTEHRWEPFPAARAAFHFDETRAAFEILRARLARARSRTEVVARDRFRAGDPIAHRSVDTASGAVLTVLAQTVVQDDADAIVTYMPVGSITKRRTGDRTGGPRGRQLAYWDGGHEDKPWTGTSVLMVHRPGDGFSVWTAWSAEDRRHVWSYVNLEEPWRRTPIGFDSRDLWLDLYAHPGETGWHWKDEDELAWAVDAGRCSPQRAAAIRREGERALDLIARGGPPFDRDWSAWRPDPAWTVPELPDGWERSEQAAGSR